MAYHAPGASFAGLGGGGRVIERGLSASLFEMPQDGLRQLGPRVRGQNDNFAVAGGTEQRLDLEQTLEQLEPRTEVVQAAAFLAADLRGSFE